MLLRDLLELIKSFLYMLVFHRLLRVIYHSISKHHTLRYPDLISFGELGVEFFYLSLFQCHRDFHFRTILEFLSNQGGISLRKLEHFYHQCLFPNVT